MRYKKDLDIRNFADVYQTITYLGKPSSNCKYVTTKQARQCAACGCTIPAGRRSLTTNKRQQPRAWHCEYCSWSIMPAEGCEKVGQIIDDTMIAIPIYRSPTIYLPTRLYNDFDKDDYEDQKIQAIDIYKGEF